MRRAYNDDSNVIAIDADAVFCRAILNLQASEVFQNLPELSQHSLAI
ncbi:hypothetical protein S1OALGB6SA_1480 [Olavius algarvensis spirochete endosymbiont]|nr:hypothetical protein S1OALGB6SA_1480 [Olavius algarvensis spirochete endosymbiont]